MAYDQKLEELVIELIKAHDLGQLAWNELSLADVKLRRLINLRDELYLDIVDCRFQMENYFESINDNIEGGQFSEYQNKILSLTIEVVELDSEILDADICFKSCESNYNDAIANCDSIGHALQQHGTKVDGTHYR